jgi:hypothetical protein
VNEDELRQNGGSLEDMARWIMDRTKGDSGGTDVTVPTDQQDDPVFAAAFPSRIMSDLPCLPEARG